MSSFGQGNGQAFDAEVAVGPPAAERTAAQQEYLDDVAANAECAVKHVEAMIEDLQASLADRRAEAERARAEAMGTGTDTDEV